MRIRSEMTFTMYAQSGLKHKDSDYKPEFISLLFVDEIRYCTDLIFSVGLCSSLPKFKQIKQTVVIRHPLRLLSDEYTLGAIRVCF